MTVAICLKCGARKFGAFNPCDACGQSPQSDEELAISLAMTDHYLNEEGLTWASQHILEYGEPPEMPADMADEFNDVGELLRTVNPGFAKREQKKPWWRFWG